MYSLISVMILSLFESCQITSSKFLIFKNYREKFITNLNKSFAWSLSIIYNNYSLFWMFFFNFYSSINSFVNPNYYNFFLHYNTPIFIRSSISRSFAVSFGLLEDSLMKQGLIFYKTSSTFVLNSCIVYFSYYDHSNV